MSSSQPRSRGRKRESTSASKSRNISNTTHTTSTKSTGPYSRNFQQNLIDHHIYPHAYRYPDGRVPTKPRNWEEINRRLSRPRSSLSPSKFSEEAHVKFAQADADAVKEKQVSTSVMPIIEGDVGDARCISGGIPFTNLEPLTEDNLVPGNPDVYYGARPEKLDRQIRNKLRRMIVPSTQDDLPILPNFLLAAKGPDGSLAVAGRQACYDGALSARGMHALQSYGKEDLVFDNEAYTITSIYHGGQLKMFTSHPYQGNGPNSDSEYCMTQLRSFAMADTAETFRQGATAYRNLRDWAKEQRDEVIEQANARATKSKIAAQDLVSSTSSEHSSNEPSTNEILSQDVLRNEVSETTISSSEVSVEEVPAATSFKTKRANRLSSELNNPQPKRQNAGGSNKDAIGTSPALTMTRPNTD